MAAAARDDAIPHTPVSEGGRAIELDREHRALARELEPPSLGGARCDWPRVHAARAVRGSRSASWVIVMHTRRQADAGPGMGRRARALMCMGWQGVTRWV